MASCLRRSCRLWGRRDSPYSLRSAARLAVLVAGQMGLKRAVFAGHGDGALVALLATALAAQKTTIP